MGLLVALTAAVPASAHVRFYAVSPQITQVSGYYFTTGLYDYVGGDLKSDRPACRVGRTIFLYDSAGTLITSTTTTADSDRGSWSIYTSPTVTISHGTTYYVVVRKRVLRQDRRHKHVCLAGRSPDAEL